MQGERLNVKRAVGEVGWSMSARHECPVLFVYPIHTVLHQENDFTVCLKFASTTRDDILWPEILIVSLANENDESMSHFLFMHDGHRTNKVPSSKTAEFRSAQTER